MANNPPDNTMERLGNIFDQMDGFMLQILDLTVKEKLYLLLIKTIIEKYGIKRESISLDSLRQAVELQFLDHPEKDKMLSSIQDGFIEFENEINKLYKQ